MATVISSRIGRFNLRDLLKGLLIAVISGPITIISQTLNAGSWIFNWKTIGLVALSAGVSYIIKNVLTPAQITITNATSETVQAVKDGKADVKVLSK